MTLNAPALGKAFAITAALLWIICSILVFALPAAMMTMGGHMMHADFAGMAWTMTIGGIVIGGVFWTAISGLIGWLIAVFYNKFQ